VELNDLAEDDEHVFTCADCACLWVDGSQLNALLLHGSLPGLDSLGGRVDPDADVGTCRSCGVGLTRIEQASRQNAEIYEVCEDCGFVFVPWEPPVAADLAAARKDLLGFFKRFVAKPSAAKR
jgi:predicted RNA-binding Zn-ribbon protein involved in translation (DUF1610 family)